MSSKWRRPDEREQKYSTIYVSFFIRNKIINIRFTDTDTRKKRADRTKTDHLFVQVTQTFSVVLVFMFLFTFFLFLFVSSSADHGQLCVCMRCACEYFRECPNNERGQHFVFSELMILTQILQMWFQDKWAMDLPSLTMLQFPPRHPAASVLPYMKFGWFLFVPFECTARKREKKNSVKNAIGYFLCGLATKTMQQQITINSK